MRYQGSCHCGRVAFEVEGEIDSGLACNCSMCERRGSLLWFVPRDKLRLTTPEADLASYTFNKHSIKHLFCPHCGIHAFGEATDRQGKPMAAVNLRVLQDIELDKIPVRHFDGRAL